MKKTYIVRSQIEVDGQTIRPAAEGANATTVELTAEQAEFLLAQGAVDPMPAAVTGTKAPLAVVAADKK